MNKIIFVVLLLVIVLSYSKGPNIQEFTKCFRECKKLKEEKKNCVKECFGKKEKKRFGFSPKKRMKMMVDHGIPSSVIEEMEKKNIPFRKPKIISSQEPLSDSGAEVQAATLWQQYRQELFNYFRKGCQGSMQRLQLLQHPYAIDDETFSMFLNFLPKWQAGYERTNDVIPDNYDDFMMNIKESGDAWSPTLDVLGEKLAQATDKLDQEIFNCYQKYEQIPEGSYKTNFASFKRSRCYTVSRAENAQKVAFFNYNQEKLKLPGGGMLYDAKTNFFSSYGNYNWVTSQSISNIRSNAERGLTTGFDVTIHQSSSTFIQSVYSSSFGFSVSAVIYGVKIGVNGQFEKMEGRLKTSKNEFHLKFGAGGLVALPVFPGTWLDYRLFGQYRNGPFVKNGNNYWGTTGSLRLLPKTVFIVTSPKLEMWVCKEDMEMIEKMKKQSMGFSVGYMEFFGVGFNFGKGSGMKTENAGSNLYKIEITGNDYNPQILAIDYNTPNY